MGYNSQVEKFIIGDLVRFTGDDIVLPPFDHRIGIVMECGREARAYRNYRVLWIDDGSTMTIAGKHLQLVYLKKD